MLEATLEGPDLYDLTLCCTFSKVVIGNRIFSAVSLEKAKKKPRKETSQKDG